MALCVEEEISGEECQDREESHAPRGYGLLGELLHYHQVVFTESQPGERAK